jgi:trimeric autotransporter adhesin
VLGRFDNGAEDVDVTAQVEVTTSDRKVARAVVNPDGTTGLLGVGAGAVRVKARDPLAGVKAESPDKLTVVTTLAKLSVTPAKRTIRIDTRTRLNAIGTFEQGITVDLSREVQWTSSAPAIAPVDTQGRVTGVAPGKAVISVLDPVTGATSTASGGDSTITIVGTLLSIEVTPRVLVLALGEAGALRAGGLFDGEPASVNLSSKVEWIVSDPTIISINPAGGVSCLAQGSTFVAAVDPVTSISSSASNGDAEVLCGVPIAGLAIEPATLQLKLDKTKKVKAFLSYANGTKLDVTKRAKWDSTNELVATVANEEPNIGKVSPQAPGEATITAVDLVTGTSSTGAGGTSLAVTVPAP